MNYIFNQLKIPDVVLVKPKLFEDNRGYFAEIYRGSVFKQAGIKDSFVQVNQSYSEKGVLRGVHYQLNPYAQAKLVRVVAGEIFDVAVDMRFGSPYYGKWVSAVLSGENKELLYIPQGFAHGFSVISDKALVIYYCSKEYSPASESGFCWNDPDVSIDWSVKEPIVSEKDGKLPLLKEAENNFVYDKK